MLLGDDVAFYGERIFKIGSEVSELIQCQQKDNLISPLYNTNINYRCAMCIYV